MSADLLAWLIIGHLVGDFILQTRWMAEKKAFRWDALLLHSSVYTLAIAVFAWPAGGLTWLSLLIVWAAHVVLDRRTVTKLWLKHINKSEDLFWLMIVHDQIWHLLVLAMVVLFQ